ncbi:MAG: HD domain-containing protein [Lachnospiraceae bacterium]|nr:HD domain-containing protein [Lachnospiraceae bacterium]
MKRAIDEIQKRVEQILPEGRFNHTLGVAYLASSLAMCYGEDPERAMTAGLLHDVAKCKSDEQILAECREFQIPVTPVEERNGFLLHAKLGAYYAKSQFQITDEEILSAIIYHTTGRPGMTFLEKIIFVSDFIEVRRTQNSVPSLALIRQTAFHDLDLAVYYCLSSTLAYLESTGNEIDDSTRITFEYYKDKRS